MARTILCRRFIGRANETAFLQERRLAAGRSHGNVVLISGEAGVGKSRLIGETAKALQNSRWRMVQAACAEFGGRPFGPLRDVFAEVRIPASVLEATRSKNEQLEAIVDALAQASQRSGVLLFIEDLHWADKATVEALIQLAQSIDALRLLVVATYRSEEVQPSHPLFLLLGRLAQSRNVSTIALAPLDEALRDNFIDETLQGWPLPFASRRAIARLSDGNPFFMEELLKSAVDQEAASGSHDVALPLTVQAAVAERLRVFDDSEQAVLAQAAVVGRRFDLPILSATLQIDASKLWPTLRKARDLQVIVEEPDGAFRFRHALSREAIYSRFLISEVRERHRRIAEAMEAQAGDKPIERLAYHWTAAGDRERAARYSELAGDAAAAIHAHDDAIAAYEQAAKSFDTVADRGRMFDKIGERRVALGQFEAAEWAHTVAADLLQSTGDAEAEAMCRVRASLCRYTLDRQDPQADLEAMLQRTPPDEFMARSRLHLGVAWIVASLNFPTQALEHLNAVDQRAISQAGDVALRFYNIHAWVDMLLGDFSAFSANHARWVEAAQTAGNTASVAGAWYNGSHCFALFGAHREAVSAIERAIIIAQEERSPYIAASANAVRAVNAVFRGDLADARAALTTLESLPTDSSVTRAYITFAATLVGLHTGDDELIRRWFDINRPLNRFIAREYSAGCAELLVRAGRLTEAQELLREGIGKGERQRGNMPTLLTVARYGTDDDCERAREALANSAIGPHELVEQYGLAFFDAIRAERAGDEEAAHRHAAAAADGFARMGFPLLQAAALEIAGERAQAYRIYERCGATADAARCAERGGSGARVIRSETLSERENEVAALIARGFSNVRIAKELGISQKTVEKYVSFAFRKLGVTSRAELAARVAREGA